MPLGQALLPLYRAAAWKPISSNEYLQCQFSEWQASAIDLSNQLGWKRACQSLEDVELPMMAGPFQECPHCALVQQWVLGGPRGKVKILCSNQRVPHQMKKKKGRGTTVTKS